MRLYVDQNNFLINEYGQFVDQMGNLSQYPIPHVVQQQEPLYGQVNPYQNSADLEYQRQVQEFTEMHGSPGHDGIRAAGAGFRDNSPVDDTEHSYHKPASKFAPVTDYHEQVEDENKGKLKELENHVIDTIGNASIKKNLTMEDLKRFEPLYSSPLATINFNYNGSEMNFVIPENKGRARPTFTSPLPYDPNNSTLHDSGVGLNAAIMDAMGSFEISRDFSEVANVSNIIHHNRIGADLSSSAVKSISEVELGRSSYSDGIMGKIRFRKDGSMRMALYHFTGADPRRTGVVLSEGTGKIQLGRVEYGRHFTFSEGLKFLMQKFVAENADFSKIDLTSPESAIDFKIAVLAMGLPIPNIDMTTTGNDGRYEVVNGLNALFYYGLYLDKPEHANTTFNEFVVEYASKSKPGNFRYFDPEIFMERDFKLVTMEPGDFEVVNRSYEEITNPRAATKEVEEVDKGPREIPSNADLNGKPPITLAYRQGLLETVINALGKDAHKFTDYELETTVDYAVILKDYENQQLSEPGTYFDSRMLHNLLVSKGLPLAILGGITGEEVEEAVGKLYHNWKDELLVNEQDANSGDATDDEIVYDHLMGDVDDGAYDYMEKDELIAVIEKRDERIEELEGELDTTEDELLEATNKIKELEATIKTVPSMENAAATIMSDKKLDEILRIVRGIEDECGDRAVTHKVSDHTIEDFKLSKKETPSVPVEEKKTSITAISEEVDTSSSSVVSRLPMIVRENLKTEVAFQPLDEVGMFAVADEVIAGLEKEDILPLVVADDIMHIVSNAPDVRDYCIEKLSFEIKNTEPFAVNHNYLFTLSPRCYIASEPVENGSQWLTLDKLTLADVDSPAPSMTFDQAIEMMGTNKVIFNTTGNYPIDSADVFESYSELLDNPTPDKLREFLVVPGAQEVVADALDYIGYIPRNHNDRVEAANEYLRVMELFYPYLQTAGNLIGYRFATMVLSDEDAAILLKNTPEKEVNYKLSGPMLKWFEQINNIEPILTLVVGTKDYLYEIVGDTISRKTNYPNGKSRDIIRDGIDAKKQARLKEIKEASDRRKTVEPKPATVTNTKPEYDEPITYKQEDNIEYHNGVPQPPIQKKSSRGDNSILSKHTDFLSGVKKSLQMDAENIERFMNNDTIVEPEKFYTPFDPVVVSNVNMQTRKERIDEAIQFSQRVPYLDFKEDWVVIFKHYIPKEVVIEASIMHGGKLLEVNEEVNHEVLSFFEILGYSNHLVKAARISYVTGKPVNGVFVTDDLLKMFDAKLDLNKIEYELFERTAPKGISYLNQMNMGNGKSIIDPNISEKLYEFHSKRMELMKVEDLLNIFTTEKEIIRYNEEVTVLSPDEIRILNNNNYRVMKVFDNTDMKQTLESHVGRQIHDPAALLNAIISLKEQYTTYGQI